MAIPIALGYLLKKSPLRQVSEVAPGQNSTDANNPLGRLFGLASGTVKDSSPSSGDEDRKNVAIRLNAIRALRLSGHPQALGLLKKVSKESDNALVREEARRAVKDFPTFEVRK